MDGFIIRHRKFYIVRILHLVVKKGDGIRFNRFIRIRLLDKEPVNANRCIENGEMIICIGYIKPIYIIQRQI